MASVCGPCGLQNMYAFALHVCKFEDTLELVLQRLTGKAFAPKVRVILTFGYVVSCFLGCSNCFPKTKPDPQDHESLIKDTKEHTNRAAAPLFEAALEAAVNLTLKENQVLVAYAYPRLFPQLSTETASKADNIKYLKHIPADIPQPYLIARV